MVEKRYFAKLSGALFLGLFALVIAFIAFVFLLPYILILALGTIIIAAIFIALWAVIYAAMVIGIAIYYFFKPMKWEKEDRGYAIEKTGEAGRRERGRSKKR